MGRIIILGILAYIGYRIYRFLAPVFRIFKQANQEFKNARQGTNMNPNADSRTQSYPKNSNSKQETDGEYIDYEEIK